MPYTTIDLVWLGVGSLFACLFARFIFAGYAYYIASMPYGASISSFNSFAAGAARAASILVGFLGVLYLALATLQGLGITGVFKVVGMVILTLFYGVASIFCGVVAAEFGNMAGEELVVRSTVRSFIALSLAEGLDDDEDDEGYVDDDEETEDSN